VNSTSYSRNLRSLNRQTFLLFLSSSIGGLLALISSVIVSNLFAAETIGRYSVILAWGGIISMFLTLRVEAGIVPAKTNLEAWRIFRQGIFSTILIGSTLIFSGLVVMFFLNSYFDQISQVVLLSTGVGVTLAFSALLNQFTLRAGQFTLFASRSPILNLMLCIGQLSSGVYWPSLLSLILCEILARTLSLFRLIRNIYVEKNAIWLQSEMTEKKKPSEMNFVKFIFAASVVDAIAIHSFPIAISFLYGYDNAGLYAIASRIFLVPSSLLATSLGNVMLRHISKMFQSRSQEISYFLRKLFIVLFILGISYAILIHFFVSSISEFILGVNSEQVANIAKSLVVYISLSFAWSGMNLLFGALELWREFLVVTVSRAVFTSIAWWLCVEFEFSFNRSILIVTAAFSLVQLFGLYYLIKKTKKREMILFRTSQFVF
jgi:O-antigen/teichoic acid export membrane protein